MKNQKTEESLTKCQKTVKFDDDFVYEDKYTKNTIAAAERSTKKNKSYLVTLFTMLREDEKKLERLL
jgi:hypothetical protein